MKTVERRRRHRRLTKKIKGTRGRPRLLVFRSKKHMYAQLINDTDHKVIVGCSTLTRDVVAQAKAGTNANDNKQCRRAFSVGEKISALAKEQGITKICFDRAGYRYHGRVKALAEGARKGGLDF